MIVFNCPQCDFPYKLKDELAGKRATCKNPSCRQVITIPSANGLRIADLGGILPEDAGTDATPMPTNPADVEAAALAALNETVKEKEDAAAESAIPMICPHCNHTWTEPVSKAGKNTLCPNEECRQRIKVPEPKKGEARENWRSTASGKPSLAKENYEKPADVMDAEAKVVGQQAWKQGGGAEQDYEPVSLKHRLKVWTLILTPVLLIGGGIWALVSWNKGRAEEVKIEPAFAQFDGAREELDPVQALLGSAILQLAAGEHALHPRSMDKDKALDEAMKRFTKSRTDIQQAAQKDSGNKAAADRYGVAGELGLALIGLGGTDEEVKDNARIRWVPAAPGNRPLRTNERQRTVHEELRLALDPLRGADFDTKAALSRRLTRELARKGHPDLAAEVPNFLFTDSELPEAKAIVALELYKPARSSEVASRIAEELKALLAGGAVGRNPTPASAQTLWLALGTEKAPALYSAPIPGQMNDGSRLAYTGHYLLQNDAPKALELARQPGGSLLGQLRALALYAEWAGDPAPAFDSALSAINLNAKSKKEGPPPASIIVRLAQLAAEAGRMDQAKQLSDLVPDEGANVWAKGSAIQFYASKRTDRIEDSALEVPESKKIRAGHLWGRMWQARQNARTMSASDASKLIQLWPKGTVQPFGLAGIALAQHDK